MRASALSVFWPRRRSADPDWFEASDIDRAQVFVPAMQGGGWLADTFGWLVGTGKGAGMALILVFAGVGAALAGLGGYAVRAVRDVEVILPDHDPGVEQAGVEADVEEAAAGLDLAGGKLDIVASERVLDIGHGQVARRHGPAVEPDTDGEPAFAVDLDGGNTLQRGNAVD